MRTLSEQAKALESGALTARALAEDSLSKIQQLSSSGVPAFIAVNSKRVLADAVASDHRRKMGRALSVFDGVPYAVKDLFDVEGEVTTAGSVVLASNAAASADADVVARLRAKGFVTLGRTNMTEFAYSGLGLNPHYGTPRATGAYAEPSIPGGSSSGTAVTVAEGVCSFGLGSDTGGSCRIPAAFNGITGFKPTAVRVSKRGAFPLSERLDSIGPLGASVACCAAIDELIADEPVAPAHMARRFRLAVLKNYVMDGLSPSVAADYARTLTTLSNADFELIDVGFPALDRLPALLGNGGIVGYEANRAHAARMAVEGDRYDPRVASRIKLGAATSDLAFEELLRERAAMIKAFAALMGDFDAVICPAVAIEAPRMDAFADEAEYRRINGLVLRNTYVFNFLDGCSGCIPMQSKGAVPTSLMVSGPAKTDGLILQILAEIQRISHFHA